ncbi:MAG: C40 family peptidase, partial [Specibacter sp.]
NPPAPATQAPNPPAAPAPEAPAPEPEPAPEVPKAPAPAPAPEVPAPAPAPEPAPTTPPAPVAPPAGSYIQVMVDYAMSKIGSPYQWGGNGPNAFDCSGLVQQAFAAAGISVPRQGTDQFWAAPTRVPLSEMRYGDLLVFDDDGTGRFGHIAIYIGNNQVVQALSPQQPLGVTPLPYMSTMSLYPYAARY